MKDQKELLKKCLVNDIPAIVFQGSDSCAVEILQAAENIYRKNYSNQAPRSDNK